MAECNRSTEELLNTLQQLKMEKSRNEQTLRELRQRRMKLEGVMEAGKARLQSVRAANIQKKASLQQKQQKLAQSEAEMNSLQRKVEQKKAWIDAQNQEMGERKLNSEREFKEFEKKMKNLSQWFRQARNFFTEEHLQKEIITRERKIYEVLKQIDENEKLMETLIDQQFAIIYKQKEEEDKAALTGFTSYEQERIILTFERGKVKAQESLARVKAERDQLRIRLAELDRTNEGLRKELKMNEEPQKSEESHMDTTSCN